MLNRPLGIYINWSAYDELSDKVQLTEELAMAQFEHFLRLRAAGAKLDCYLMDCFWYEPLGAYRTWRKPQWSDDGERWLAACREHGVLPGLWFGNNAVGVWSGMHRHPSWAGSIDPAEDPGQGGGYCLFEGPFLTDYLAALAHWYDRGVRVFKLDFLNQDACLAHHRLHLLPQEIRSANAQALRAGLARFRAVHPEAIVIGYNGVEDVQTQTGTEDTPRRSLDPRWLDGLTAFYTGDPRPADVPAWNFWRSKDVYSDHRVRCYLAQGFDRTVLDNAGFMSGTTGTCYHRGTEAWTGMLVLSLARGGWMNTYYGNLDLLSAADATWFARAQQLFWPLLAHGTLTTLGGLPGTGCVYGFRLSGPEGSLTAVVNAGQLPAHLALPEGAASRILFRDVGYQPQVSSAGITVGPEQLVLLGTGAYATVANDLGVQDDVVIPASSTALPVVAKADGHQVLTATVQMPATGSMRIILRQRGSDGVAKRTSGGAPPDGKTLGKLITLTASRDGQSVAIDINYDKAIWSGLSWAVGEIPAGRVGAGPLLIRACSLEAQPVQLELTAYAIEMG